MRKNRISVLLVIMLMTGIFVSGCGGPATAETGDTVSVHYTGTLGDGEVFDTSAGGEPLEFTLGTGQVIPGFEQAVTGMQVGESVTVTIPADEAYGQPRDDLILEVDRNELPPTIDPETGMQLQMTRTDGGIMIVTVTEVTETTVTLDANHPLAGQDLTFEIELVEIVAS